MFRHVMYAAVHLVLSARSVYAHCIAPDSRMKISNPKKLKNKLYGFLKKFINSQTTKRQNTKRKFLLQQCCDLEKLRNEL